MTIGQMQNSCNEHYKPMVEKYNKERGFDGNYIGEFKSRLVSFDREKGDIKYRMSADSISLKHWFTAGNIRTQKVLSFLVDIVDDEAIEYYLQLANKELTK